MFLRTVRLNLNEKEIKEVNWDGKVFSISTEKALMFVGRSVGITKDTVYLKPEEMLVLIKFAGSLGKEDRKGG